MDDGSVNVLHRDQKLTREYQVNTLNLGSKNQTWAYYSKKKKTKST